MGATQIREMAAQKIKKDAFSKLVLECTVANSMNSMNFCKQKSIHPWPIVVKAIVCESD